MIETRYGATLRHAELGLGDDHDTEDRTAQAGLKTRCVLDALLLTTPSLVLSRVHWVRPELVVEVKYLTWTEDSLLGQVVYKGEREDKQAREVVRS